MKGFLETVSKYQSLELKRADVKASARFDDGFEAELQSQAEHAWVSNGGSRRGHPARSLPFSLEVSMADFEGVPLKLEIIGVFARFADARLEPPGTLGASIQIKDERDILFRQDLVQGRHYDPAESTTPINRVNGDGTSLQTCGLATLDDTEYRLDRLTIDLPTMTQARSFVFRDLGSPASFVIFGVFVELERATGCPFHSKSGRIPLREVGAIVRIGDRRRFSKALDQLTEGIFMAGDLDEARGQALTFLAVVTAGMLESGGSRELHRVQLEAARKLDRIISKEGIATEIVSQCERIAEPLFNSTESPTGHLMERAMAIVDRNFAKSLTDSVVAQQLGLSTSHFRFLFKQATGSPFHKYILAVRLEKAKQMLVEQGLPVSQVANAVGFTGLSHFSRAFTQRFSANPTRLRRQAG